MITFLSMLDVRQCGSASSKIYTQVKEYPAGRVFLASDASNWGAGGLSLEGEGKVLLRRPWTAAEAELHINVKEAVAAMETIRALKQVSPAPVKIIMAIDNVTAKAWLEGRAFPSSKMESEIFTFMEEFHEDVVELVLVKSEENAADGASRNVEVQAAAVGACREVLIQRRVKRWFD
jgi:hypothetical protein